MHGQSLGCMRMPAAWAQVGWKAVEQRPWEHCTQQPFTSFFIRFLQYTHFCVGDRHKNTEAGEGGGEVKGKERKHSWVDGKKEDDVRLSEVTNNKQTQT